MWRYKHVYFYLELWTVDCIICTLFINQLVSKPIQPAVRVKDSVPNKTVGMKKPQTSNSGKFCNTHLTLAAALLADALPSSHQGSPFWKEGKRKLQANITDEHRCKNPQESFSKQNSSADQKAHTPWSSWVYSRDARILEYTQINLCDTP